MFFAPLSVDTAIRGFMAGLVPPGAGCEWQERQALELKRGPSPLLAPPVTTSNRGIPGAEGGRLAERTVRADCGGGGMNPDTTIAPKTKRAALYVRVSTTNRAARNQAVFEQNPEVQELPLRQMAEQRGWTVTKVYSDRMSGSKSDRPGLNSLMRDARRGAFDVVVVWRFDRFARSIEQLVLALAEFRTLGIEFVSSQEALDTSTPVGKAMFTIIGAMAELERNVIRERVVAGLEHARNHGTKSGAAIGRPRAVFDRASVVELRDAGRSWRQIATALGISTGTARTVFNAGVQKPSSKETRNSDANTHLASA